MNSTTFERKVTYENLNILPKQYGIMENEPYLSQKMVHDEIENKHIYCYYAGKYYSKEKFGPNDYSRHVLYSKWENRSEEFWPQIDATYLYACKQENENFDCSCLIPSSKTSDRLYNVSCQNLQDRIEKKYGLKKMNILIEKPGCQKSTTLKFHERLRQLRIYADIDLSMPITGKSFLLIDDVVAGGSHVIAYSSLLYKNGAKNVAAVLIAENQLGW